MRRTANCALMLLLAMMLPCEGQEATKTVAKDVRGQLIGAWRLVWDEEMDASGKMVRRNESGIIMYTSDGHMAVQIRMESDRSSSNPVRYGKDGYEGYYGTFTVNEKEHSVTHHVENSLMPDLVGKDLTRIYEFSGKQLILHSSRADEHWRICWEKY